MGVKKKLQKYIYAIMGSYIMDHNIKYLYVYLINFD